MENQWKPSRDLGQLGELLSTSFLLLDDYQVSWPRRREVSDALRAMLVVHPSDTLHAWVTSLISSYCLTLRDMSLMFTRPRRPRCLDGWDGERFTNSLSALGRRPHVEPAIMETILSRKGQLEQLGALLEWGDVLHMLETRDPYLVAVASGIDAVTRERATVSMSDLGATLTHMLDMLEAQVST
jgi:hypothetical protein